MNPQSRAMKMLLLAKQNIQEKPNRQSDAESDVTRDLLTFCDTFDQDKDLSTLLTDSTNLASSSASNHHLLADDNLITDDDLLTLAEEKVANLNFISSNFPEDEINIEPEDRQNFVLESIHGEEVPTFILEEELIEASTSRSDKSYEPSENETSSSENENEVVEELQNNTPMQTPSRTRRKRRHVDQKEWKKNKNKILRQEGKEYFGKQKQEEKWNYDIKKKAKAIGPRCKCSGKSVMNNGKSVMKCNEITEDQRTEIFTRFWNFLWNEKQLFLRTLVEKKSTSRARDRKKENESRREFSYIYFLQTTSKIRVCKTMFCNTLSVAPKTVAQFIKIAIVT